MCTVNKVTIIIKPIKLLLSECNPIFIPEYEHPVVLYYCSEIKKPQNVKININFAVEI